MIEVLRVRKRALSRSSLVEILAQLIFSEMYFIWTEKSSCWDSQTKFYWRLRCLGPFVVIVLAHSQHARLPL